MNKRTAFVAGVVVTSVFDYIGYRWLFQKQQEDTTAALLLGKVMVETATEICPELFVHPRVRKAIEDHQFKQIVKNL